MSSNQDVSEVLTTIVYQTIVGGAIITLSSCAHLRISWKKEHVGSSLYGIPLNGGIKDEICHLSPWGLLNSHYKRKGCFKYSPRDKILSNDLFGDFQ